MSGMAIRRFPASTIYLLLFGYTSFCVISGIFLAEGTLHPGRRLLSPEAVAEARKMSQGYHARFDEVAITAGDGVVLRAWSIELQTDKPSPNDAVVLLHGVSDNRVGMTGYAQFLLDRGYSVLMPDARAHGTSGGEFATYGLLEGDDIRRWFEWLSANQHPQCIFGFGESMGAAQILESLKTEPNFCAVGAESPFSNLREIGFDRVGQAFHTGPWLGRTLLRPVVEIAFQYARWKYKLDLEQASPEDIVAGTKVPVFLIHGQIDSNIPVRHSYRIRAQNSSVNLWEVPNADHCGAITVARDELETRLTGWFTRSNGDNHFPALSTR
jgi:uncharacterized protein